MYVPKHHEESDTAVLHALIEAHPLGAFVTLADGEIVANHIPFLLDRARGTHGTLIGHVARANPVWKALSRAVPSVVLFQGFESYITPSWYTTKQTHGRDVPTWNYAVVHAHGVPRAIEDPEWLLQCVTRLTDSNEAGRPEPWHVDDAPRDYIDRLLGAIVGIEIPIDRLVGKWKVSQNRADPDKRGVVDGLLALGDPASVEMAALVAQHVAR